MAKLVLMFLVVCCLVQLIIAARITRDTSTETKPASDFDSIIASGKKSFEEFFTKENLDKFTKSASDFGVKIKDSLVESGNKVKDLATDLTTTKKE